MIIKNRVIIQYKYHVSLGARVQSLEVVDTSCYFWLYCI